MTERDIILITGATGTIGSRTARALLDRGARVRIGVRDPARAGALTSAGAEAVRFDYDDPSTLAAAFAGVKSFLLLTPFVEDPEPYAKAALHSAKEAGVEAVVRLSAVGADPKASLHVARVHGEGDEQVKASGLGWTLLRPTFFMDNLVKFHLGGIRSDGVFYGASAGKATAYVSSRDIAEVAAAALLDPSSHRGKTYELTGPEALTDDQVAEALSAALGRPVKYVDLSLADFEAGSKESGLPDWAAADLAGLEGVKAAGWAAQVSPATEEVLGRRGETIRPFLERELAGA